MPDAGIWTGGQIAGKRGLAGLIEDVGEHASCVQIEAG
jgi:hypothetical protein